MVDRCPQPRRLLPYFLGAYLAIPLSRWRARRDAAHRAAELPKAVVSAICVGSVAISFHLCAAARFLELVARRNQRVAQEILFEWVPAGAYHLQSGRAREVRCGLGIPARSALRRDDSGGHRRRPADPYLFHRLYGARGRLLPLLWIFESVHVFHADAGPWRIICYCFCWMGRRWDVQLFADWILLQENRRRTREKKRSSSIASVTPDFCWAFS